MKSKLKRIRVRIVLLAIILLSQSCRVYDPGTLSIEEAATSNSFVKIRQHQGKVLKYKWILEEGGKYYGITMKRGNEIKTEIDLNNIKIIKRKNNTMSTIASVTLGGALVFTAIVAVALSSFDLNFGGGWTW